MASTNFGKAADSESSADSEEPTTVLRMMEDYKLSRRQSLLGRHLQGSAELSSAAGGGLFGRRLQFEGDDSIFQRSSTSSSSMKRWHHSSAISSASKAKIPKFEPLGPDPLEGLSVLRDANNRRRHESAAAAHSSPDEDLRMEVARLKMRLADKEAEVVSGQSQVHKWESHASSLEVMRRKEKMQMDQEREKMVVERRRHREEVEDLKRSIATTKKRERNRQDLELAERRDASQGRYDLEDANVDLQEENRRLLEQINDLSEELNAQERAKSEEISSLAMENKNLRSQLSEEKEKIANLEENQPKLAKKLQVDLDSTKAKLDKACNELEKTKDVLQQNEDAVNQRHAMRDRLARFPELQRENDSLRTENRLLTETMENVALLKQEVSDLKQKVERSETMVAEGQRAQNEVVHALQRIKRWEGIGWKLMSSEERSSAQEIDSINPDVLDARIAELQKSELILREQLQSHQSALASTRQKLQVSEDAVLSLESRVKSLEGNNKEQSLLIKRFQRKLLLVSKERDSYKGVLESYEHELTFTGGQFERDRVTSLEGVIQAQKEIIEKLEGQLVQSSHDPAFVAGDSEQLRKAQDKVEELSKAVQALQESRDSLEEQLQHKYRGGDYNPSTTKVLHFTNNPTAEMTKSREVEVQRLKDENECLKARIQLIEEGQTKDLTILVGQKVEEGASSQEVQNLKEQLQLAEVRKERLIEAFRKTSQDFREVCYQLTGYRIDGLANNQYRLSPIYAESPNDRLLFKREANGECQLLETSFSAQLTELIDLHLNQQHSIPVFLAAVITDLFSRQTFDTVSSSSAGGGAGGGGEGVGGDDDDPICLD